MQKKRLQSVWDLEGRIFFPLKERVLQLILTAALFAVLLFCEFLIYYLVIFQYSCPEMKMSAFGSRSCANMDHVFG